METAIIVEIQKTVMIGQTCVRSVWLTVIIFAVLTWTPGETQAHSSEHTPDLISSLCFFHQVALSETLHELVTEFEKGSSNKSNFLLAN